MCSRALVYAGSRSYALYLWHLPLSAWLPRLISTNPLLWFLGWLVLAFIAAELSHRLVEGPALRLKDRLIRPAAPAPETTVEPRSTYTPDRRSRWLPGVGADARPVS
jgi:peptidoglycan/LPS O-acetylase OafA/YrhL